MENSLLLGDNAYAADLTLTLAGNPVFGLFHFCKPKIVAVALAPSRYLGAGGGRHYPEVG